MELTNEEKQSFFTEGFKSGAKITRLATLEEVEREIYNLPRIIDQVIGENTFETVDIEDVQTMLAKLKNQ